MGWLFKNKSNGVFRGSHYFKSVWIGKRTVKDGECAAIWGFFGTHTEHVGPTLAWVFNSQVRFLDRYVASQHQYLVIQHRNGRVEHVPGPIQLFCNPVHHEAMEVRDAESLNASDVLVIYSETTDAAAKKQSSPDEKEPPRDALVRSVVSGPRMYYPSAEDTVLEHYWTDIDEELVACGPAQVSKTDRHLEIQPADTKETRKAGFKRCKRSKLSTLIQHIQVRVTGVLTADDVVVTVKLTLSVRMCDIGKMLAVSADPYSDIVNAVVVDVSNAAKRHTYEEFANAIDTFNDMKTYIDVMRMSDSVGFKFEAAVCRGWQGSAAINEMHASAMQSRASLKLKLEQEQLEQELQDLQLSCSLTRLEKEQKMVTLSQQHELESKRIEHKHVLEIRQAEHEQKMKHQHEEREGEVEYYESLKKRADVDVTKYLVAKESLSHAAAAKGTPAKNHDL